jgi:hypothetical protein
MSEALGRYDGFRILGFVKVPVPVDVQVSEV